MDDAAAVNPAWARALTTFDATLRAHGMAEKTRRAYGVDVGQLAEWAVSRGNEPQELDARELRRYAAVLSEGGCSKATVARKLAAIRTFYRALLERREIDANPADLVASPKRDSYLPRVLKPGEVADLLARIPASTPLELRDRAMFELAYAAGLRAEEIVNLDIADLDPDGEELRVEGKGGRTRIVPAGARSSRISSVGVRRWPTAGRRSSPGSSSRRPAGGCPRATSEGASACGRAARRWPVACRHTRCVTRSPPICSRAARICARSRSFSAMRALARPRRTLG
jgi:site-specific recombinase XerD